MENEHKLPPSFSALRRLGIGLNVALAVAALGALVLMVNYLAARHYWRLQWTSDARYALSAQTRRVLAALTNQAKVTILFDRTAPLFSAVSGLLKEYAYVCPRVSVEHVDYKRDLARTELIVAKYQLAQGDTDQVIFELNGRTKTVRGSELSEYDWTGLLSGDREVRRVAFKGEALFTGALASVLEAQSPMAYFLQGHGEHDPASDEPMNGYSALAKLLRQKNIATAPLGLAGNREIPDDCQLLIVAGPQHRFDPAELDKIGKYLAQGGRLLALLSYHRSRYSPTGLERLLANWGVAVGENLVFDPKNSKSGSDLIATNLTGHPAVKPLRGSSLYLVGARSVGPQPGVAPSPEAAQVQVLVSTSDEGYTASEMTPSGVPRLNPVRDRRGAIPLMAAVERGNLQGVSADRGSTRMVVVGESLFLGNGAIENQANMEFASQVVNWLLDRPTFLVGIAPRPVDQYRLMLSRAEMAQLRWILLGALPGAALLLGFLVWLRRRA
jgi:ABC-type uncharacterized transport system involved in gliding motility auxiliary subunit